MTILGNPKDVALFKAGLLLNQLVVDDLMRKRALSKAMLTDINDVQREIMSALMSDVLPPELLKKAGE